MARLSNQMKTWMRLGAAVRVRELDAEVALIRSEFPDLGRANTPASSVEPATNPVVAADSECRRRLESARASA